jgi:hypothetical protein
MTTAAADPVALDTSAAIPYLMLSHPAHGAIRRRLAGRTLHLTTHSLAESYSVLTRLPGDARVAPLDAAALLSANFGDCLPLDDAVSGRLPDVLAPLGIAGGAVYDAMGGIAAQTAGIVLVTRDARAISTYTLVGATFEVAA